MISFDQVTITYPDSDHQVLSSVDLFVPEGELALVVGRTGVGKSTLLGCMNGLVPHFTGGHLAGMVRVAGHSTADHPPRELADVVGVVGQDPLAGFVTDTVEEELAYTMEQLAVPPDVMRKRVEETLDLLGIADLRSRALRTLSGGQQQRVAIGAALTAQPRVLVLDEPTSALDPTAAEEVLAAITRLVHDLGVTVVVAEHRLERVVQYADMVIHLPGDGTVVSGPPDEIMSISSIAPPVVRLGQLAGWRPLPLSIRDARRAAGPLRERLAGVEPGPLRMSTTASTHDSAGSTGLAGAAGSSRSSWPSRSADGRIRRPIPSDARVGNDDAVLCAERVTVAYGPTVAVREVTLDLHRSTITALMGRNGAGKSSLLWAIQGSGRRDGGSVSVASADGRVADPGKLTPGDARGLVGLVPQTPGDLLYLPSVAAECRQADRDAHVEPGSCRQLLERITPDIADDANPRDLSEGQRLSLVLAIQLTGSPGVVLLDEPTRGLDYTGKENLIRVLDGLAATGRAIVVSTHDVEFVASCADRVVVMADGDVVADGPTADVIVASPAFAPQVAKILRPLEWLNVDQVRAALGDEGYHPPPIRNPRPTPDPVPMRYPR